MRKPKRIRTVLTAKEARFAQLYTGSGQGDGTNAAIAAGCTRSSAAAWASRALGRPRVIDAIRAREQKAIAKGVRGVAELQEWWNGLMDSPETSELGRLKASELLAKSHGAFIERSEVHHKALVVLPPGLDADTLRFIARGGLRALPAQTVTLEPEPPDDDDGDDTPDAAH